MERVRVANMGVLPSRKITSRTDLTKTVLTFRGRRVAHVTVEMVSVVVEMVSVVVEMVSVVVEMVSVVAEMVSVVATMVVVVVVGN